MISDEMLKKATAEADQAIRDSLPAPAECEHEFSPSFQRKMRRTFRKATFRSTASAMDTQLSVRGQRVLGAETTPILIGNSALEATGRIIIQPRSANAITEIVTKQDFEITFCAWIVADSFLTLIGLAISEADEVMQLHYILCQFACQHYFCHKFFKSG